MSDQQWDVLEFVLRFRNGELEDQFGETLDRLTPEQIEYLQHLLQSQGKREVAMG
jgi:hypothetical protein